MPEQGRPASDFLWRQRRCVAYRGPGPALSPTTLTTARRSPGDRAMARPQSLGCGCGQRRSVEGAPRWLHSVALAHPGIAHSEIEAIFFRMRKRRYRRPSTASEAMPRSLSEGILTEHLFMRLHDALPGDYDRCRRAVVAYLDERADKWTALIEAYFSNGRVDMEFLLRDHGPSIIAFVRRDVPEVQDYPLPLYPTRAI